MIHIDPKTRKRYVLDQFSGDFIYDMKGDSSVSQEDIPFIGNYKDYTGSKLGVSSKQRLDPIRLPNELQGTDPGIEEAKLGNLTERGKNADINRTRTIRKRVNIDKSKRLVYQ